MDLPPERMRETARALVQVAIERGELKRLPEGDAIDSFLALAANIAERAAPRSEPLVVAISGTPGTGKSTLSAYLQVFLRGAFGLTSAGFSLDDCYLSRAERARLAQDLHPLFARRGVPGTHHVHLALSLLQSLRNATATSVTRLPRFDKHTDDPRPQHEWPVFEGRPDVVLVDNWFWGIEQASEEELREPINATEARKDADGTWRRAVDGFLAERYPPLFEEADYWIHLRAPSWQQTVRWRIEQEMDLRAGLPENERWWDEPNERLQRFLQTFERWGVRAHARQPDVTLVLGADHRPSIQW